MSLTTKAKEVYRAIIRFEDQHGISPLFNEIMAFLGWNSRDTTERSIAALTEAGMVEKIGISPKHKRIKSIRPTVAKIASLRREIEKLEASI